MFNVLMYLSNMGLKMVFIKRGHVLCGEEAIRRFHSLNEKFVEGR